METVRISIKNLPNKSSLFSFKIKDFFILFLRRTSHSYGYFSVSSTKIAVFGYTKVKRLCSRFTWPCVYPSLYGDVPPVSTRITSQFWRVLTSFVPPIRNQGVSLAPCQGHALWNIFLPTTGSFFVIYFF